VRQRHPADAADRLLVVHDQDAVLGMRRGEGSGRRRGEEERGRRGARIIRLRLLFSPSPLLPFY
jgi:hypothetical protein